MTSGRITANLPSRDFDSTEAFYARLGFAQVFRNASWMILTRNGMQVEFFPHPDLKPSESWFSACLRINDIDALHDGWSRPGLSTDETAMPRLTAPFLLPDGLRMFALVDPDGSLWRVIETEETS